MTNYYVVLEIPDFSNEQVIKKAYRTLSKKYHPDVNKDPFAHTYFLKINEAYDFLMDANKRLLLHQYLQSASNPLKDNFNDEYKSKVYNTSPEILLFATDKKYFSVGDYILLQWNVNNCSNVHISLLGNVFFSGTHYLKIEHYADEFIILMTVEGLDKKIYKYQIRLLYNTSNPAKAAFERMKTLHKDVDEIHFKNETFFGMNARLNSNEFKNRIIVLITLQSICIVFFFLTKLKVILFLLLLIVFWFTFAQLYKRAHDTVAYKNKVQLLFIPFYNLYVIKKLFSEETEQDVNEYGLIPSKSDLTFAAWFKNKVKLIINKLSLVQQISLGSFLLLWVIIFVKASITYNEKPVELTSYYTEVSRPTKQGTYKSYFVVFNNTFSVKVTEEQFNEIIYRKKYNRFTLAQESDGDVAYVQMTNSKTQDVEKLRFGILQSSNPLLLLVCMLFLSQLYVINNLKAPKELPFANGYMIFTFIIYLYGILATLF